MYCIHMVHIAVCADRHCTTDHWHVTSWSHHTGAMQTPTIGCIHQRACQVQIGMSGLPVAVRAGASLLGRWLLPRVRQHSALSADVPTSVVPRTLSSYGDRTFVAAGPRLWNSVLVQLCNPDITYGLFRWQLKGHLFLCLDICGALDKHL